MLTIEEVITATLKSISVTTKVILANDEVTNSHVKSYLSHYKVVPATDKVI